MAWTVLRLLEGQTRGRVWESGSLLRVGRLEQLGIVTDDSSVSRYHAEVRVTGCGRRLRGLGSTNGARSSAKTGRSREIMGGGSDV